MFNGVSGVIALAVRIFTNDIYTLFFAVCSLFLALINLVPVPTHDGARVLEALVSEHFDYDTKKSVMDTVYYSAFIFLVLLSLYVLNVTNGNFSLIIFLCVIFISIYAKKEHFST